MRKLSVFNNVSLDGFFTDRDGDMSWAHAAGPDPEFDAYVAGNAGSGGTLLFGRVTYQMMAAFWPSPMAAQQMPEVARGMNETSKIVFSRTLDRADWQNTRLIRGDLPAEIRKLKTESGSDMVILGSGSIVAQLAREGLIDSYTFVVCPVALGAGRSLFEGLTSPLPLRLAASRSFKNGKAMLSYEC